MQPSDCTIYAVCIPGEKVRYEARSRIVPIMGGAYALSNEERETLRAQGYVFDDENASLPLVIVDGENCPVFLG